MSKKGVKGKEEGEDVTYIIEVDRDTWKKFKRCLRKDTTINDAIVLIIKDFIKINGDEKNS